MTQLQDKVVIVTGGARGLGRAYAESLAAEGARVVVGDVRGTAETVAAVKDAGGEAMGMTLDVGDARSCEDIVAAAVDAYGRLDGLVNNAALYGGLKNGRFETLEEDEWRRVMEINVVGIWRCCKAAIGPMKDNGSGSIVNITSLAAVYGLPYSLHYATSKAAVIGMTRSMARELGRNWIRVNCIAPSAVMTEGTAEFMGDKLEKAKKVIASGQTLQRNLETDDLVGTVLYLLGDGSKFVPGQTIMVDGGTVFL